MWEDTIVAEVRSIRQVHAEKFGFDLKQIYADLKREERASKRKLISFPAKPVISLPVPKPRVLSEP